MSDISWIELGHKLQNSVPQLIVTGAVYNSLRPYRQPDDEKSSGSSFIIDGPQGLLITNAHVVSNAINITGRLPILGKQDLKVKVLSICHEKDFALCQFTAESLAIIKDKIPNLASLTMQLDDHLSVKQGDEVMTLGYPLGDERIKITTGIVSGFHQDSENDNGSYYGNTNIEDAYRREASFIQITAPINPGNSGGPLINKNGKVIGVNAAGEIFSQNIGYAIISRLITGFYSALLTEKVIKTPTWSLDWNPSTPELFKTACQPEICNLGIYVRKIWPDSCLGGSGEDRLKEGDILTTVSFPEYSGLGQFSGQWLKATIDRYGEAKLYYLEHAEQAKQLQNCQKDLKMVSDRIFSLYEIVDLIAINSDMILQICREGQLLALYRKHQYITSDRLPYIYPVWQPYQYLITAGMSISNLTMNHVMEIRSLHRIIPVSKRRYTQAVVITQVFPGTNVSESKVLQVGDIITEVNEQVVKTIADIQDILAGQPERLTFKTHNKFYFIIFPEKTKANDMEIYSRYGITV